MVRKFYYEGDIKLSDDLKNKFEEANMILAYMLEYKILAADSFEKLIPGLEKDEFLESCEFLKNYELIDFDENKVWLTIKAYEREPTTIRCWRVCPYNTFRILRHKIYKELRRDLLNIIKEGGDLGNSIVDYIESSLNKVINTETIAINKRKKKFEKLFFQSDLRNLSDSEFVEKYCSKCSYPEENNGKCKEDCRFPGRNK